HNPARAFTAVKQLAAWVARPDWPQVLPAYARCVRITRDQTELYPVDSARLVEPAEHALAAAAQSLTPAATVDAVFGQLLPIIPVIAQFFDQVLVMADDPAVRANRLGLLQRLAGLAHGVADLSKLEGF
ncbi:MAG: hypothetical protein KA764_09310, partial [Anaerolineales bacterium]|nr:hypothetical protein [Anaerolineales bacterium]